VYFFVKIRTSALTAVGFVISKASFWAKNGGDFVCVNFRYPCFWAKNGGGGLKNVKKWKKNVQNDKEKTQK